MNLMPANASPRAAPWMARCLLGAMTLLAGALRAEPVTDGPYVFHIEGRSEARWLCGGELERREVVDGRVDALCGDVPALQLETSTALAADSLPGPSRWAALSDIHGQAGLFLKLLAAQGLIDGHGDWSWGDGVLVITGDVFDRGPSQLEALWAIYRLAQQATLAGGRLELLLGNHEMMVLGGDLRYLHPRYLAVAEALDRPYDQLFAADTELGAWLRRRATVLRLGDTLFLHGGLHPRLAVEPLDLRALNAGFRAALGLSREALHGDPQQHWLFGADGPVWYRGYFLPRQATSVEVDELLAAAQVRRIVVGHTTQDRIRALYDARIIGIDAAMKDGRSGELLVADDGRLWRGLLDGRRLPLDDAAATTAD